MKRRGFITLLGGAAAWPVAAGAQQAARVRRIGVLSAFAESDPEAHGNVTAFRQALEKLGWTGGDNVRIELKRRRARTGAWLSVMETVSSQSRAACRLASPRHEGSH